MESIVTFVLFQTFDNDSEMLAPDLYYNRGCVKCKE